MQHYFETSSYCVNFLQLFNPRYRANRNMEIIVIISSCSVKNWWPLLQSSVRFWNEAGKFLSYRKKLWYDFSNSYRKFLQECRSGETYFSATILTEICRPRNSGFSIIRCSRKLNLLNWQHSLPLCIQRQWSNI